MFRELKYWLNTRNSGLRKLTEDARDLLVSELFATGTYIPKYKERELAPIFQKDQLLKENCSFQTGANVLAVYFGENISARWLVAKAWQQGLCNRGGGAELRNWLKVAQKYGVVLEKDLPSDEALPWEQYVSVDFKKFDPLAGERKIGSYRRITKVIEYLRCIDEGYAVALGRYWRTSYDRSNGFKAPWIITEDLRKQGYVVGGHALAGIGYSFLKDKDGVTIEQNSYSERWGDKGRLYCELRGLQKDLDIYGGFAIFKEPYTPKDIVIKGLMAQLSDLLKEIQLMTKRTKFYETALGLYRQGAILSPNNIPLGCGYALTEVWNKAFPNEKVNWVGTTDWWAWLKTNKFREILEPEAGCIIISPTPAIPPQSPLKNGHIGVVGKNKAPDGSNWVMSNNSLTGKWDAHWTVKSWNDYYHGYGKIKTSYFKLVG